MDLFFKGGGAPHYLGYVGMCGAKVMVLSSFGPTYGIDFDHLV